ncbi:MAG: MBL fold metallo-hydrolase, partial [Devosia sp.]
EAFDYCFSAPPCSDYPPILNAHEIDAGAVLSIDGPGGAIRIDAFEQTHGSINSLGFRIGRFAYSCDLSAIPAVSDAAVSGLDFWVIDALRHAPHPSHLSLSETLNLIAHFAPARAVLTNMHIDMDYRMLQASLPSGVEPGFDGMRIDVSTGAILNL